MIGLVQWFVVSLLFIKVFGEECPFSNIEYKNVVSGIEGKVPSSEPLHIDRMDHLQASLRGSVDYSLTNITLRGIKDCEVINLQCGLGKKKVLTFQYYIECPRLSIKAEYNGKGELGTLPIDGRGHGSMITGIYIVKFDGIYERIVGKDQKPRPVIKNYTLNTDPKEIIKYNMTNVYQGDTEKGERVNRFLNEYWKEMEIEFRKPIVAPLMNQFIDNLNAYSKAW